jgi:hypothetical protein
VRVAGDRKTVEVVQLELRRLASRLGLPVSAIRIRRAPKAKTE